jgi:transcriptional regulator with XRE-family HTH domain
VDDQTFEEALHAYRTKRGLTQAQLAAEVGISSITMSRYETGGSNGVQSDRVAALLTEMVGQPAPRPERVLARQEARRLASERRAARRAASVSDPGGHAVPPDVIAGDPAGEERRQPAVGQRRKRGQRRA